MMIKKAGVYIMESAEIMGDVRIGEDSSVWNKVVIRGDEAYVQIGNRTNIQDMCVLHTERDIPLKIGDNVTIGHGAIIHCKKIGANCIIGMGAMLLVNAEIGEFSVVAAGAVVVENKIIPPRSLVMGVPGEVVRPIDDENIKRIKHATGEYMRLSKEHYEGRYKNCFF
jgi:carbonic anhydrase/acetyltransferase-like protein (isoleucine patch superfamily)